ncbi:hypothetical protein GCM10014713_32080 [Streptomyces purpureus]|uniref:Uncharacterized protein n=1 Tax=Streptomyces purpureus TaxID=1951 RepID=A0A918LPR4_9ACTN|nr:hypothetical protein GCM10014713_32080 [Streptomyces purpureus]
MDVRGRGGGRARGDRDGDEGAEEQTSGAVHAILRKDGLFPDMNDPRCRSGECSMVALCSGQLMARSAPARPPHAPGDEPSPKNTRPRRLPLRAAAAAPRG